MVIGVPPVLTYVADVFAACPAEHAWTVGYGFDGRPWLHHAGVDPLDPLADRLTGPHDAVRRWLAEAHANLDREAARETAAREGRSLLDVV